MRYYKDDIVELINTPLKEIDLVFERNQGQPLSIVGNRFRVNEHDGEYVWFKYINSRGIECRFHHRPHELILYKRPLRNFIKQLLDYDRYII